MKTEIYEKEQLLSLIGEKKADLAQIKAEIDALESRLAALISPFQIGDKVILDHQTDRVMQVTRVSLYCGTPILYGSRVKKNGELGKQEFELFGKIQKLEK